jgi:hypothetical protein
MRLIHAQIRYYLLFEVRKSCKNCSYNLVSIDKTIIGPRENTFPRFMCKKNPTVLRDCNRIEILLSGLCLKAGFTLIRARIRFSVENEYELMWTPNYSKSTKLAIVSIMLDSNSDAAFELRIAFIFACRCYFLAIRNCFRLLCFLYTVWIQWTLNGEIMFASLSVRLLIRLLLSKILNGYRLNLILSVCAEISLKNLILVYIDSI